NRALARTAVLPKCLATKPTRRLLYTSSPLHFTFRTKRCVTTINGHYGPRTGFEWAMRFKSFRTIQSVTGLIFSSISRRAFSLKEPTHITGRSYRSPEKHWRWGKV